MKNYLYIIYILLLVACQTNHSEQIFRNDFTNDENKTLLAAKKIIDSAYYGTLITIDKAHQPKARIMEPFLPDNKFIIYLATNPLSRKVKEIKNNHRATLHYFDKNSVGYVSLMGKITIETNDSIKKSLWKAGWERFYKNQDDDYMLLKFTPDYLEVISITEGLTGDKKTWKPSRVNLYKSK